jgi:hypothetical protein
MAGQVSTERAAAAARRQAARIEREKTITQLTDTHRAASSAALDAQRTAQVRSRQVIAAAQGRNDRAVQAVLRRCAERSQAAHQLSEQILADALADSEHAQTQAGAALEALQQLGLTRGERARAARVTTLRAGDLAAPAPGGDAGPSPQVDAPERESGDPAAETPQGRIATGRVGYVPVAGASIRVVVATGPHCRACAAAS